MVPTNRAYNASVADLFRRRAGFGRIARPPCDRASNGHPRQLRPQVGRCDLLVAWAGAVVLSRRHGRPTA